MKKQLILLSVIINFVAQGKDESFTLLSWNLLSPSAGDIVNFTDPSGKKPVFRKDNYNRLKNEILYILQQKPVNDKYIVALQEVDQKALVECDRLFGTKRYTSVAYQEKGDHGGVALYCRGFEVIDSGFLKLPVSGSDPGACAWGVLQDNIGNKVLVANIHINRGYTQTLSSTQAGYEQWRTVGGLKQIMNKYQCPIIIAGDLNTSYAEVSSDTKDYIERWFEVSIDMFNPGASTMLDSNLRKQTVAVDHVLYAGLNVISETTDQSVLNVTRSALQGKATLDANKNPVPPLSDHAPTIMNFDFQAGFSLKNLQRAYAALPVPASTMPGGGLQPQPVPVIPGGGQQPQPPQPQPRPVSPQPSSGGSGQVPGPPVGIHKLDPAFKGQLDRAHQEIARLEAQLAQLQDNNNSLEMKNLMLQAQLNQVIAQLEAAGITPVAG